MAEVAGLALGVLGIAGLFTSCIENFDIIVRAKDFGEEFDRLCTTLSVERLRLALWGESLGLLSSSPEQTVQVPYNHAIDREDVKPCIVACLCQLRDLLAKADVITERYALESTPSSTNTYMQEVTQTPRGMRVLRESFQRLKERARKNQKQKSVWEVTRWSIHDCAQFESLVDKIHKLMDGLESITNALGVLERQRERLIEEIDTVSDKESLSLLQDVGSSDSAPAALKAVSGSASIRLTILSGDSQSYYTAKTGQTSQTGQTGHTGSNHGITSSRQMNLVSRVSRTKELAYNPFQIAITNAEAQSLGRTTNGIAIQEMTTKSASKDVTSDTVESIPQHQRWMSALLANRPNVQHVPAFSPEDVHYGEAIQSFKTADDQNYRKASAQLAVQAHTGLSLAQRVFIELRNIHRAEVPFISAAPVGDALDKILACIEGPPGTPYQGGTFWITVRITESQPPSMRFHTRIYHPNIYYTGKICADSAGWWQTAKMLNKEPIGGSLRRDLPWFSEHATNHYSLGAFLVALCGLLASPNIEDPLVPEIAEKYVTDYNSYCEAARLYTQRYTSSLRPADEDLVFPDCSSAMEDTNHYDAPCFRPREKTGTTSDKDVDVSSIKVVVRVERWNDEDIYEEMKFNNSQRELLEQGRTIQAQLDRESLEEERLEKARRRGEYLRREHLEQERFEQERLEQKRLKYERLPPELRAPDRLGPERLERARLRRLNFERERFERMWLKGEWRK